MRNVVKIIHKSLKTLPMIYLLSSRSLYSSAKRIKHVVCDSSSCEQNEKGIKIYSCRPLETLLQPSRIFSKKVL